MQVTSCFLEVNHLRVRYLEAGPPQGNHSPAPPVLLLHGGGIDSALLSWEEVMPALAGSRRVIAPDFPGYGESGYPGFPISIDNYVAFVEDFLAALDIPRVSLAGISMGGAVSIGLALKRPDLVQKLVLVDSYGLQETTPYGALGALLVRLPGARSSWGILKSKSLVKWSLQSLLHRPEALTPHLLALALEETRRPHTWHAFNDFQRHEVLWSGPRTCFLPRLGEITSPTLIIHGEKDSLVPPIYAEKAQQAIPGAQLHWMKECGHWPQRDNPEEFIRVVGDFLQNSLEKRSIYG